MDSDELFILSLIVWLIASWLTHVIVCLSTAAWGFLVAGALFFPVGVIHGTGYWFGFFH